MELLLQIMCHSYSHMQLLYTYHMVLFIICKITLLFIILSHVTSHDGTCEYDNAHVLLTSF